MPFILGIDPSLRKLGFVVLDTTKPMTHVVERGLLKTKTGVLVQRLILQAHQVRKLIKKYDIKFIASEAPYFGGGESEVLYALHQFLHAVYLKESCFVLVIPPQQLKKLIFSDMSVNDVHKAQMTERAKDLLGLHGRGKISEDEADAYHVGTVGMRFYQWFIEKSIFDSDLKSYENKAFNGKHTFTRGAKAGTTEYSGFAFRENEMFFDYKRIKELTAIREKEEQDGRSPKKV